MNSDYLGSELINEGMHALGDNYILNVHSARINNPLFDQ